MLHEAVHVAHQVLATLQGAQAASDPAPAPNDGSNFAALAALIASISGLISAVGAIIIGLRHRRPSRNSEAADKAIEYLIKQNRELLKGQAKPKPARDAGDAS